ncbi:unnamed protein product, partial [Didymodactylos carnosus]
PSECKGGGKKYSSSCNSKSSSDHVNDVQQCLNNIHSEHNWGCVNANGGRCKCTVDTPYQNDWQGTFNEARKNLNSSCHGFQSMDGERHEG